MKQILIAVPTYETCNVQTMKSIYGLERPAGYNLMLDFITGYDVSRARNNIVHEAIDYNFDYVLMVDSDIILPRNAVTKLLSRDKGIILGWYLRRINMFGNFPGTGQTELFSLGQKDFTDANNINIKDIPENECIEIKGGGFGCALVKVNVFKKLGEHSWFKYVEYNKKDVLSEDNYFCSTAARAGFKIFYDSSVRCRHICSIAL